MTAGNCQPLVIRHLALENHGFAISLISTSSTQWFRFHGNITYWMEMVIQIILTGYADYDDLVYFVIQVMVIIVDVSVGY